MLGVKKLNIAIYIAIQQSSTPKRIKKMVEIWAQNLNSKSEAEFFKRKRGGPYTRPVDAQVDTRLYTNIDNRPALPVHKPRWSNTLIPLSQYPGSTFLIPSSRLRVTPTPPLKYPGSGYYPHRAIIIPGTALADSQFVLPDTLVPPSQTATESGASAYDAFLYEKRSLPLRLFAPPLHCIPWRWRSPLDAPAFPRGMWISILCQPTSPPLIEVPQVDRALMDLNALRISVSFRVNLLLRMLGFGSCDEFPWVRAAWRTNFNAFRN